MVYVGYVRVICLFIYLLNKVKRIRAQGFKSILISDFMDLWILLGYFDHRIGLWILHILQ